MAIRLPMAWLKPLKAAPDIQGMGRVPFVDRLLLWLFRVTGTLLLVQGLALACAVAATLPFATGPLASRTRVLVGALCVLSVAAAGLIAAIRRRHPESRAAYQPGSTEALLFGLSLLTIVATTLLASAGLPPLWRDISDKLAEIGFWGELGRPSQFGGILMLPVLLALSVPAVVTGAAAFSFAFSLVLLARLRSHSPAFPAITAMGSIVQTTLVGGSWLAAAALGQVSELAAASASTAPDLEVRQLATELTAAVGVVTTTSTLLVTPTVLLAAWAAVVWSRQRATASQVTVDPRPADVPAARLAPVDPEPDRRMDLGAGRAALDGAGRRHIPDSPRTPISQAPVGIALAVLGMVMLLFSGADRLRARPTYLTSIPEAGASNASAPRTIRVTFSRPLDPASTLSLVYVPIEPSISDISRDVEAGSRVLADDPRTLEMIPPALRRGLYLVRWVAYPESGGVARMGSLTFGVNAAVPGGDGVAYSLIDRDAGSRGRRYTSLAGLLLLAIGALAWSRDSLFTAR